MACRWPRALSRRRSQVDRSMRRFNGLSLAEGVEPPTRAPGFVWQAGFNGLSLAEGVEPSNDQHHPHPS